MRARTRAWLLLIFPIGWAATVGASESARAGRMMQQLNNRFAAADVNGDGFLTASEARGRMPIVSRHFAEIDTQRRGGITLGEIRSYIARQAAIRAIWKP